MTFRSVPMKIRVYAFLWIIHRFLEFPSVQNDFLDNDKAPDTFPLYGLEMNPSENIDTPEELERAQQMRTARQAFLKKNDMVGKGVVLEEEGTFNDDCYQDVG